MENEIKKRTIVVKILMIIMMVGIFATYILMAIKAYNPNFIRRSGVKFTDNWSYVDHNHDRHWISLPSRLDGFDDETIVLENVLPGRIGDGAELVFYTGRSLNLYIDDNLRCHYDSKENPLKGPVLKAVPVQVSLNVFDSAKKITIELLPDYPNSIQLTYAAVGDSYGIFSLLMSEYGIKFILATILILFTTQLLLIGLVFRFRYKADYGINMIVLGLLISSLWSISDNPMFAYVFGNGYMAGMACYLLTFIFPFPFMLHLNKLQGYRYQKSFAISGVVLILNMVVFSLHHVFTPYSFLVTKPILYAVLGIVVAYIFGILIYDKIKNKVITYQEQYWGYVGVAVAGSLEFLNQNISFSSSDIHSGLYIMIGVWALVFCTFLMLIRRASDDRLKASEAAKASKTKTNFLAQMSHEIRTPINAILGINEMILRESKEDSVREYAHDIRGASKGLLSLINDILDISKVESGKLEIVNAEYEFASLINDVASLVKIRAKEKNLGVCTQVDESLPSKLIGDDIRIRQCVTNLLTNAVKYTEKGSITLKVQHVSTEGNIERIRFSVIDTGVGIAEENIPIISEMFSRFDQKKNRAIEGTGLGLSITAQLLKLMGSKIEISSTRGKGSNFSFEIDQTISNNTPIGNLSQHLNRDVTDEEFEVGFTAADARVLIVDDNSINRKVLKNLIKDTLVQVDEADSGFRCLEKIEECKYDLIFMDYMMPGMNGIEALDRIRSKTDNENVNTPVVVLTANAVTGAREMYMGAGFDEFLSKPIDYTRLEKAMLTLIPDDKISVGVSETKAISEEKEQNYKELIESITGINLQYAFLFSSNYTELNEVLLDYAKSIENNVAKIEKYFMEIDDDDRALNSYRIKVHAAKSSSAMVGILRVSELAALLEDASRQGDIDTIKTVTPIFLNVWREYIDKLDPLVQYDNSLNESTTFADMKIVREQLHLLDMAMDDFDMDSADYYCSFLSGFKYPEEYENSMNELFVAVRNIDNDRVKEIISDLV